MNLLNLAETKPHNPHYLKRYLKFIEFCRTNEKDSACFEYHHILPKAKDLFPEYSDLTINIWNSIKLTIREHIIAHVILWKAYGGSQATALHYILNVHNTRKIPTSIDIRYAAKLKSIYYLSRVCKGVYKDSTGIKYSLHYNDPLIKELSLVGNNYGLIHSEATKNKMSKAKDKNRTIKIYFLDNVKNVKLYSNELIEFINQGWSTIKTPDDYAHIQKIGRTKVSEKMAGKSRYMTPDGKFFGMLLSSDPVIVELNLSFHVTERGEAQWLERARLAHVFNTGSVIYNNGKKEKKFKYPPEDPEWKEGRLERNSEWVESFANAIQQANRDKIYWNNGVICKKLPSGERPDGEDWKMGMLKRTKS